MKTELEKMLAGELYLASDAELENLRRNARRLTRLFNNTTEDETELRAQLLQELLGKCGSKIHIEPPFRCDYGCFISVGENFYANFGCVILDCNHVTIGDNVMLAPNVQIYGAHHPLDASTRISGPELGSPISIGNNVWIGGGAIILPGVSIGDNSVIGAGSVVTRDVPPNVVAAGNPCRVLREV
jgi:maltose O-acetyltransferase